MLKKKKKVKFPRVDPNKSLQNVTRHATKDASSLNLPYNTPVSRVH